MLQENTFDDRDVAHAEELARFLHTAAQENPSSHAFGRGYMNVLMKHGGDYIRESLHGIRRAFAGKKRENKFTQMLRSLKDRAPPDSCKRSNVDVAIEKYLKAIARDLSNVYLNVWALLEDIKAILYGQNAPSPKIDMLSCLTEHVLSSSAASWLTVKWNYGKELDTSRENFKYTPQT